MEFIIGQGPSGAGSFRRAKVVKVTDNGIVLRQASGTVTVSRLGFESFNIGDSVLVDGLSIIGRVRPQPAGKIFQV